MDNARCPPQPKDVNVGDIKVIFLPPNVTFIAQPMDQGVLECTKLKYRKLLLDKLLLIEEDGDPNSDLIQQLKKIDILDVIRWSVKAWEQVEPVTIVRSWRKLLDIRATDQAWGNFANLKEGQFSDLNIGDLEGVVSPEEDVQVLELLNKIPGCSNIDMEGLKEWMNADQVPELTEDDIVQLVDEENESSDDENDESDETEGSCPGISHEDGLEAIEKASSYMQQQEEVTLADQMMMRRLAFRKKLKLVKQKNITDFFKKKKNHLFTYLCTTFMYLLTYTHIYV